MAATSLDATDAIIAATATACAKINLTLEVLETRDDGFHEIRSLVIGIGLYDRIRGVLRRDTGIEFFCGNPDLMLPSNLIVQAAEALAKISRIESGVGIQLHKSIPLGGGLGGGSSDAASTLTLCSHLWGLSCDDSALARIGAGIGSDVPLFFSLPAAIVTGRGEHVTPVHLAWSGWVLLVHAPHVVSTPQVYKAWRTWDSARRSPADMDAALLAEDAQTLSNVFFNDLEPAVRRVCPAVGTLQDRLERIGMGPMRISGAGSTMYKLFDDKDEARDAARTIECQEVDATTTVVAGPVGRSPILEQGE